MLKIRTGLQTMSGELKRITAVEKQVDYMARKFQRRLVRTTTVNQSRTRPLGIYLRARAVYNACHDNPQTESVKTSSLVLAESHCNRYKIPFEIIDSVIFI